MRAVARALLLGASASLALACAPEPPPPHLLLLTLDTTRPDHLGCYGYERDTSPQLDRLAAESLVYTRAYSTSSWTLPAHASLFTGKFVWSHGARYDPDGELILSEVVEAAGADAYRASGLAPDEQSLAQLLAAQGLATGAVVAGPWMKRIFGLDRGFDHYDDRGISSLRGRLGTHVTDAALAWIDSQAGSPFFLFLNYYDPHYPYDDPERHALRFLPPGSELPGRRASRTLADVVALYDGEIRYMDEQIGRLLDGLRGRGLYDDAWIIVTADHGELLGEHGLTGHGKTLFEQEIRIPLIVKFPADRQRRGRNGEPIQLTDVFRMVLEAYGIPLPEDVRRSNGGAAVLAEVRARKSHGREAWRVLLEDGRKLHWSSTGGRRLFDVGVDPEERNDLSHFQPARVRSMEAALDRLVQRLPEAKPRGEVRPVDDETRRALEGLGYLESAERRGQPP